MASKAATLGDPRRPQEVKKYTKASAADEPPSTLSMIGLMLGVGSMMLRMKLLAWIALFVSMAAIANSPVDSTDYKQVMMTLTFAAMGLVNNYFVPHPGGQPPAAAAPPPPAAVAAAAAAD
eukprot:GHUV01008399.1.p1 GENE.GHUV01008399.1~~GHUV01008399.1.p1  ORF type:complete len:121 (+),score=61.29 GHUV01008399.1:298-660(+)